MRLFLLAVLASVGASSLAAQERTAPHPISRDEAMTMPTEVLASVLLGQLGTRVTAVTRPNYRPGSSRVVVSGLQDLTFATEPHATDVVGLCAANLIEVDFEHLAYDNNRSDTPVRVRGVRAELVYKVFGELEPLAEVSETRQAEEDRRCRQAGPVIPPNYSDGREPNFFRYRGDLDLATALLALQRALGGQHEPVSCNRGNINCLDPAATMGGLNLASLAYVHVAALDAGNEPNRYRIEASFVLGADENQRFTMGFAVEAQISQCCRNTDRIQSIGPGRFWVGPVSVETP
jgi:hypothetical protein